MATPLYKIPSTPVYAICSDFVVLLILDTFFRFYILHRLNSIPSIISTQSGSGKRVKSGMSRSRRPGPFSLQSASRTSVISVPNTVSFFQYRIPCQDFGESCFPSTGHIPYFAVRKFGLFPSPTLYFGQSRIPRVLFRFHCVTFYL